MYKNDSSDLVRTIIVCTDGYVDCESEAFATVRSNLARANLFSIGIGTSVNRHLIEGLARAGAGEAFFAAQPGDLDPRALSACVSDPLLRDVDVRFSGLLVEDVVPRSVPALYASRPIAVFGKWIGPRRGMITLSGRTADGEFHRSVDVAAVTPLKQHGALRELWARKRVSELCDDAAFSSEPDAFSDEITRLGLLYRLLTPYTSFVAVDRMVRTAEQAESVTQPLPLPAGVSPLAVGYYSAMSGGGMAGFTIIGMCEQSGWTARFVLLILTVAALVLLALIVRLRRASVELGRAVALMETVSNGGCPVWPEYCDALDREALGRVGVSSMRAWRHYIELHAIPLVRNARQSRNWAVYSLLVGAIGAAFGTEGVLIGMAATGGGGVGATAAGLSEALALLKYSLLLCIGFALTSAVAMNRAERWQERLAAAIRQSRSGAVSNP